MKKKILPFLLLLTSCTITINTQSTSNSSSSSSNENSIKSEDSYISESIEEASESSSTISECSSSSYESNTLESEESISSLESLVSSEESSSNTTSSSVQSSSSSIEIHNHKYDPYLNIKDNYDREHFYSDNYVEACCYEDAMYRSAHGLISGSIEDQGHLPSDNTNNPKNNIGQFYKVQDTNYTYLPNGQFESYTINSLNGNSKTIYYNAAYSSLEDVAAYLFAFGESPINTIKGKNNSAKNEAISSWWKFGRVNDAYFSNNTSSFEYEPHLPRYLDYYETDFGSIDEYQVGNYLEKKYNDGYTINRSACRFVYRRITQDWSMEN